MLSDETISYPPSDTSEFPSAESSSSSLPSSRLPYLAPPKDTPDKTVSDPSYIPRLIMPAYLSVTTGTSPSDMPSFFSNPFTSEITSRPPSPGHEP